MVKKIAKCEKKVCAVCGKKLSVDKVAHRAKYCSTKCKGKARRNKSVKGNAVEKIKLPSPKKAKKPVVNNSYQSVLPKAIDLAHKKFGVDLAVDTKKYSPKELRDICIRKASSLILAAEAVLAAAFADLEHKSYECVAKIVSLQQDMALAKHIAKKTTK